MDNEDSKRIIPANCVGKAVEVLKKGDLIAFPTETVYGLGANAYSNSAVAKIFVCKKRSNSNPISVCYADLRVAETDVEITEFAEIIAKKFLPGPVTLLLKRKEKSSLSSLCSAGLDTIGIRIPKNQVAINLLSLLDFPITASSANISGNISHTTAESVAKELENILILDGGKCSVGIPSTVIDCSSEKLLINRIGAVTPEEIVQKCGFSIKSIEIAEKIEEKFLNLNR